MKILRSFKILLFLAIAILIKPFCKKHNFKNLIVIGSRNGKAGYDNGEILHQYFLSKKINALLISDRDDKERRMIKFNSLYSIVCVLNSSVKIVTHSESDLFDYWWRLIPKLKVCCIQHGVIGIKRLKEYESKIFDKFLISNSFEKRILNKYYSINDKDILEIGLPRFDTYEIKENTDIGSCLIIPTWRKDSLLGREVFRQFMLVAHRLSENMKNVNFYIAAHPELEVNTSIKISMNKNLHFINSNDINNKIKSCDLLITDYSSIAWDFLYMNKYIAFYTHDYENYSETQGLYCDFENFLGCHIDFKDLDCEGFIEKVIFENQKKNKEFIKEFGFYNHNTKSHCEFLSKILISKG